MNLYYHIISDDSLWSCKDAKFVVQQEIVDLSSIIELPDINELKICLRFYNYLLGELKDPDDRKKEILSELDALDEKYLTKRVLSGMIMNDEYSKQQVIEHELLASQLRLELSQLNIG